jgi:predicted enzyme related to lactoylglutathione lyase
LARTGNIRLALHGGYNGLHNKQGKPVAIHFQVEDIPQAVKRVERFGGSVKRSPRKVDYRPEELMVAYTATFADPDQNEFEILQVLERFDK